MEIETDKYRLLGIVLALSVTYTVLRASIPDLAVGLFIIVYPIITSMIFDINIRTIFMSSIRFFIGVHLIEIALYVLLFPLFNVSGDYHEFKYFILSAFIQVLVITLLKRRCIHMWTFFGKPKQNKKKDPVKYK